MKAPPAAALLFLAATLAGCLTGSQPPAAGPALAPLPPAPIVQDHDHGDPALHAGAANVARVAHHSGYGDGALAAIPEGQGFSELAVWAGERDGRAMTLAFLGRRDGPDGGFVVIDATDPRNLTRLGDFAGLANYDVEVSHDGLYAFSTTQWLPTQQQSGSPDPLHDQRGVYVVGLQDLAAPSLEHVFYPPTRGAHTITYHRTQGNQELLLVNTYDFLPDPSLGLPLPGVGSNPVAHRTLITEFVRSPAPTLRVLGAFEKTAEASLAAFPHDTFLESHPLTGQLLMYVSYWDLGAYVVDITDPAQPREVSRLNDFAPSRQRAIHYARPIPTLVDGRHVTITEPELGPTDETGQLTLFDTTDPANPTRLGYWTLPGNLVIDEGLVFSPHNFDIRDGRVYLAHYHGGVWVIDVSDAAALDQPRSLGYYQAAEPRAGAGFAPNYWSAVRSGPHVFASDIHSGLAVLRFALD